MLSSIRKDSEVEVTSEEEGFQGSWFRAILEENPNSRCKKLRVRYTTLNEEGSPETPLTETVDQRFIRPVPPEELYDGVVLEEGSVVDAYRNEGWWIGLVMKKLDDEKFSVYFGLTNSLLHLERKELRAHFDWDRSKWIRRKNMQLVKPSLKQASVGTRRKTLPKKTTQPVRNSTQEMESSEGKAQKRKREENSSSVANVEETKETTMVLSPFEKKLPIWKTFETMEVFKTIPQSPHFIPLACETSASSREVFAVGMMLTFSSLLKEVEDLQFDTPINILNSLKESFSELEKHGFDVKAPHSRICEILSLKDKQAKKIEERGGAKKVLEEEENKKNEIETKLLELQRQKKESDKKISAKKWLVVNIDQELEDMKLKFQKLVSAPW